MELKNNNKNITNQIVLQASRNFNFTETSTSQNIENYLMRIIRTEKQLAHNCMEFHSSTL